MNIQPNLIIRPEDIRGNSELWIQKFSVILFTDPTGKPWWTKEYQFLPNHERYNQAVKWIKDTEFPLYNCRIIKNENNEIELVTRNYFGESLSLEQAEKDLISQIYKKIRKEINNPTFGASTAAPTESEKKETDPNPQTTPSNNSPKPTRTNPTSSPPTKPNPQPPNMSDSKLKQWKNLSLTFTETLIREWESRGFNPNQTRDWLNIGLTPQDANFSAWLRDIKKKTPDWCLNYGNLTELKIEYQNE